MHQKDMTRESNIQKDPKNIEKLPMICALFSFVFGYNVHKIGSSLD